MAKFVVKINCWATRCWVLRRDVIPRWLSSAGSLASLWGLLFAFLPPFRWWVIVLVVIACACTIAVVLVEATAGRGRRVYHRTDTKGIREFMHTWIESGGRVAVWSRDMSWANDSKTKQLLAEKAKRSELVLCLPAPTPLSEELATSGAEVFAYGKQRLESPAARFTIAFFGKAGARVAVGRPQGDFHVIEEFESGQHHAFDIAADLVDLTRSLQATGRKKAG